MPNTRRVGSAMENRAAQKLTERGYRIVQRNFRCRSGEIDIIAYHKGYLVFVEVKYRKNAEKGCAAESVDFKKQQKICRTADYYLRTHCRMVPSCRFDVAALDGENFHVYENAFDYIPKEKRR